MVESLRRQLASVENFVSITYLLYYVTLWGGGGQEKAPRLHNPQLTPTQPSLAI